MTRITSCVVCIGLLCLGAVPRASAEPIRITGGTFLVPGLSAPGSIAIVGTRGFSLVDSSVNTLEGRVDPFINCTPCGAAGSTISIGAFQGGTSFFGPATLDGVTYHVGDGIDDPERINLEISGTALVPGLDKLPTSVTAPFTLEGSFLLPLSQPVPIEGRGVATLFFTFDSTEFPTSAWIERVRYDFTDQTPVPEPATLTLVAGGLLAMARAARKRRESEAC